MPIDLQALWNLISNGGGALALALFLVVAFMRGWLIPRFIYDQMEKRLNRSLDATEAVTTAVDRLTDEIRTDRRKP